MNGVVVAFYCLFLSILAIWGGYHYFPFYFSQKNPKSKKKPLKKFFTHPFVDYELKRRGMGQRIFFHHVVKWLCLVVFFILPLLLSGVAKKDKLGVIDYRQNLNKNFVKISRARTDYIIVHTSEAGLVSTLRTLSQGKSVGRYRTVGGHSHYAIARDGRIYRTLDHIYRADHAGLSMWNGLEDISSYSVGIELVGYHYSTITPEQYRSLSGLLNVLQKVYHIPDKNILTHCQISYGKPNRWISRPHRGRKRCALNFEREKAGLTDAWADDPDVRAGRLARDRHIYAMFYKIYRGKEPKTILALAKQSEIKPGEKTRTLPTINPGDSPTVETNMDKPARDFSNVISKDNSAWNIAGEDYDDPATLYVLPGNLKIRGDQVGVQVGWDKIPLGTQVLLNQPVDMENNQGPVYLLGKEYTAWSFAGAEYSSATTFYFLPDDRITPGNKMPDWDSIPDGTRMIIGYNGPFLVRNIQGQTPWGIAGRAYNHPETIYFIPAQGVIPGDQVKDFSDLPHGSQIFLKIIH